uniref:Uncharacterized protein n=1 Tax=Oryzias melastigma TaxID=30732 RepID=A0A3B3CT60_ORYME
MCVNFPSSLQAILLMFPAANPLLGYLLYKAAKWLACMKKLSQVLLCTYVLPTGLKSINSGKPRNAPSGPGSGSEWLKHLRLQQKRWHFHSRTITNVSSEFTKVENYNDILLDFLAILAFIKIF